MAILTEAPQPYMISVGKADDARLDALSATYNPLSLEWLRVNNVAQNARFLDVGCGNGSLTIPIALTYPEMKCVAVDLSSAQVRLAEEKAQNQEVKNIQWKVCDVYHLEDLKNEDPELFDIVHSRFVLTHLQKPEEAMDAMLRMLKPGGMLIMEEFGKERKFEMSPGASDKAIQAFEQLIILQAQLQRSHLMDASRITHHLQGKVQELKIETQNAVADTAQKKAMFLMGAAQGIAKLRELQLSYKISNFGYENGEDWMQDMVELVQDDHRTVTIKNLNYVIAKSHL